MNGKSCSDRLDVNNCVNDTYRHELRMDVRKGLTAQQKCIPSKYFYDSRGSALFEEICLLPEYYQTRTELSILRKSAPEIMGNFEEGDLVELGSGANRKIRILLDAVPPSHLFKMRYIPVDVSESVLLGASRELLEMYPGLDICGIVADFTTHVDRIPGERNQLFILFGSTIGNFTEEEGGTFLANVGSLMGVDDRFLVGMDMVKEKEVLECAYNDSRGVTAAFNRNVLHVLNRELKSDFEPHHFDHVAFFNSEKEQVEMHLQANRTVSVTIEALDLIVDLKEGETIHTEICRKFTRESARQIVENAGLEITRWHSDPRGWFSLIELGLKKPRDLCSRSFRFSNV